MKQRENTSKKLICLIEITHIVKWDLLILSQFKMNLIKLWQCIEHAQDFSQDVIIPIFILEWNI